MLCRQCGTEIAEKALICFRCGTATTEAVHKAPVLHDRPSSAAWITTLVVLDLIALAGLYLGFTASSGAMRLAGWGIFVAATAAVVGHVLARRR